MEKIDPQIKITNLDDSIKKKILGSSINLAPQPKMTAPDTTSISGDFDAAFIARYQNSEARILEIENILVRLGLINTR